MDLSHMKEDKSLFTLSNFFKKGKEYEFDIENSEPLDFTVSPPLTVIIKVIQDFNIMDIEFEVQPLLIWFTRPKIYYLCLISDFLTYIYRFESKLLV